MWTNKREPGPVRSVKVQVVMQFNAEPKDRANRRRTAKLGDSRGKFK
jgi:hypothetical protein